MFCGSLDRVLFMVALATGWLYLEAVVYQCGN